MAKQNVIVFQFLKIAAWIIFVGLCIEAGKLGVNFLFSIFKPEFVKNLYEKIDLSEMYDRSEWVFYQMYSLVLTIAILKAILFYQVIILVTKIDLNSPFNQFVSDKIFKISYQTFSIGIISFIARQLAKNLAHKGFVVDILNQFWEDSQAYILMAAVVYVIATIFKKGIDIQTENDLTI